MSEYSQIKLDDEMRHSYIEYAMSVIVEERSQMLEMALSQSIDVLYSMHELKNKL